MIVNNEMANSKRNYNFLTELNLIKSSSYKKFQTKLELDIIDQSPKRKARSKSRSRNRFKSKKKKRNKKLRLMYLQKLNRKSELIKKNTILEINI